MFKNRKALLFGALLFYLYFRGTGGHGLIDPLEGINASIALHMSAGGNRFIPRIGEAFAAGRSMGAWWLEALALKIFGWSEFAVRFFSALSGLIMIWAAAIASRDPRSISTRASWLSASICAGMTICFTVSQLVSPHAIYACLMSLTMAGIIRYLESRENKRCLFTAHFCSTLCFIAYGFEGLLLVWLAVIAYSVLADDMRMLKDFFTWPAGVIFTVSISGLYFLLLMLINTDIIQFMHCRIHTYSFGGIAGMCVFAFLSFMPFHGFIIRAVCEIIPKKYPADKSPEVFMLVWACVFGFSAIISGDMLALSCCAVPLSSILGKRLDEWLDQKKLYSVRISVMISILLIVPVVFILLPFMMNKFPVIKLSVMSLIPWGITTGLFLFAAWYYTKTRQIEKWVRNVPGAALLCLMPLAGVFSLTAEKYSVRDIGLLLRDSVSGDDRIIQYNVNYPSVYFYTLRNSGLIDSELTPGIAEKRFITDEEELSRIWNAEERVFMIIPVEKSVNNKTLPKNIFSILEFNGMLLISNQKNENK